LEFSSLLRLYYQLFRFLYHFSGVSWRYKIIFFSNERTSLAIRYLADGLFENAKVSESKCYWIVSGLLKYTDPLRMIVFKSYKNIKYNM